MRRNPQFIMRAVADQQVIVPVGEAAAAYHGMLTVNGSGARIWELLSQDQTEQSLASALTEIYDIELDTALADVERFLEKLRKVGAITD